ncbi:MAG: hypothetical protein IPO00_08835 [Betaproteobacteria bacterium]|nr:hypothetical protein [Betaproteobacteria bacterium]
MDQVGICNLALGWLGATPIVSIADASTEAQLCAANWAAVRDAVLEAKAWTFATERTNLAADGVAPSYGFGVRYQVPSTLLRILEVDDGSGYGDLEWVREGAYLLTDQPAPLYIRFVKRVEDPALWSPGFVMAMSYRLAAVLTISLTENRASHADLWRLYVQALEDAARLDGMQGRAERQRQSVLTLRRY